ncbi:hypothetical protein FACS1894214_3500 [Planctomycetales bacterium]|nr:hypothetical protein FACS1894214_3500 [Planctomycetales bacterium]
MLKAGYKAKPIKKIEVKENKTVASINRIPLSICYVPYENGLAKLGVSIFSFYKYHIGTIKFIVHEWTDAMQQWADRLQKFIPDFKYEFREQSYAYWRDTGFPKWGNDWQCYLRFYVPYYFPNTIYLDCDTAFFRSADIIELHKYQTDNIIAAAARDASNGNFALDDNMPVNWIELEHQYVNSGVLVFGKRARELLVKAKQCKIQCRFGDQSIINYVCSKNDIKLLPIHYNYWDKKQGDLTQDICIGHFVGSTGKPFTTVNVPCRRLAAKHIKKHNYRQLAQEYKKEWNNALH